MAVSVGARVLSFIVVGNTARVGRRDLVEVTGDKSTFWSIMGVVVEEEDFSSDSEWRIAASETIISDEPICWVVTLAEAVIQGFLSRRWKMESRLTMQSGPCDSAVTLGIILDFGDTRDKEV
jgi:hypothetical protein